MTSPQIGNDGVSAEDTESQKPQVAGFIVREDSPMASNWRADATLREYLVRHGIVAISDIDTRALTRKIRNEGAMRGIITTDAARSIDDLLAEVRRAPSMSGLDLVQSVSTPSPFAFQEHPDKPRKRIAVFTFKQLVFQKMCDSCRNLVRFIFIRTFKGSIDRTISGAKNGIGRMAVFFRINENL
jgi:carbamoylphosphate synthase small subunit